MPAKSLALIAIFFAIAGTIGAGAAEKAAESRNQVKIEIKGDYRHIDANGIPDYVPGAFPNRHNPNTIESQDYQFKVPLKPKPAEKPTRAGGPTLFGIALNGVVFDPGTAEFWNPGDSVDAMPRRRGGPGGGPPGGGPPGSPRSGWNYEAIGGHLDLGLDKSNAHVQPNGAYHYHGLPTALLAKLAGSRKETVTLIGWAADGYPIYSSFGYADPKKPESAMRKLKSSYRLKTGTRPSGNDGPGGKYDGNFTADFEYVKALGDLDESNGRTGVTPDFPEGTYYYVLTDTFPYVPRLFHGEPDESFRKKGGPGGPGGPGGARGGRRPPPDGGDEPR